MSGLSFGFRRKLIIVGLGAEMRLTLHLMYFNWQRYFGTWRRGGNLLESLQKTTGRDPRSSLVYYIGRSFMTVQDDHRMGAGFLLIWWMR